MSYAPAAQAQEAAEKRVAAGLPRHMRVERIGVYGDLKSPLLRQS